MNLKQQLEALRDELVEERKGHTANFKKLKGSPATEAYSKYSLGCDDVCEIVIARLNTILLSENTNKIVNADKETSSGGPNWPTR